MRNRSRERYRNQWTRRNILVMKESFLSFLCVFVEYVGMDTYNSRD